MIAFFHMILISITIFFKRLFCKHKYGRFVPIVDIYQLSPFVGNHCLYIAKIVKTCKHCKKEYFKSCSSKAYFEHRDAYYKSKECAKMFNKKNNL